MRRLTRQMSARDAAGVRPRPRDSTGSRQSDRAAPTHAASSPEVNGPHRPSLLLVDDDASLRVTLSSMLTDAGYDVLVSTDGEQALRTLQRNDVDVVLTDLVMPGMGGEDLLRQIRESFPGTPVVVMTSFGSVESAVSLLQAGAAEYLTKPLEWQKVLQTMQRVLHDTSSQRERTRAARQFGKHVKVFMGRSRPMRLLFQQVGRVASASVPVLITGETGVGKELIALAVHGASGREPFVPVNCGAIPANLLESELFGHVRGAFTGADRDKTGLFEAANGGTLFLDEIAELPLSLQAKLLRAVQSGEFRRVGDVEPRHADVRLISATHRDLAAAVAAGTFREDLFYRINVLRLEVPPLRERIADIPLLAEQFLADVAARDGVPEIRFSPAAQAHLLAFGWPGNVRQLKNVVERAVLLTDGPIIDVDDLPDDIRDTGPTHSIAARLGHELTLAEVEREHILGVLARAGGNRSRAAEILGLPRRTLYRRLEEYGITGEDFPG